MTRSNEYHAAHRAIVVIRPVRVSPRLMVVGVVLAAIVVGWVGAGFANIVGDDCDEPVSVEVAVAPSIAPAVSRVAAGLPQDTGGGCFRLTVTGTESADVVARLAAPDGPVPHAWVPESTWWLRRAATTAGGGRGIPATGTPVASSPVVLAVTRPVAAEFVPPGPPLSWQALLDPDEQARPLGLPDPTGDPVGLSGVLEIRRIAGQTDSPGPANAEMLRRLSRIAAPAGADLPSRVGGDAPDALQGAVVSEQEALAYNARGDADPLVAVYPDASTPGLDHPFVVLPGAADLPRAVAERLRTALLDDGAGELAAIGLRTPAGVPVRDGAPEVRPVPLPPPATVDTALRGWAGVNLSARILDVIDVSGSMDAAAGRGQTRLSATVTAGGRLIGLLRDTTEVSLWRFAAELDGERDHQEVLPLVPLRERRGDVFAALSGLRTVPGARTGLNDTTLAAYRQARGVWKAGRLNLVLIATDGRDNDPDGVGLGEVMAKLAALQDPERPLPLIFFGIGPDVDAQALQAMSGATGGRTFLSLDGNGVEDLFFQALDFLVQQWPPQ
jgi:hypothetical protein